MHVLSVLMNFDMGSFSIWHILDNHNHGTNSEVLKYRGPKPYKSPFSNVDLVLKKGEWHGHTNKISIECVYMPHAHVHGFLEGEQGDLHTSVEWNIFKNVPHFPSNSCTYDPKLWSYPFTTMHTPEWMTNLHMANMIPNRWPTCHNMLHECLKLLKIIFGPN
jgi:hypothetical protein